jgi:hypothetical protein
MYLDLIVSFLLAGAVVYYFYKDNIRPHLPWGKTVKDLPPTKRFNYRSKPVQRFAPVQPAEPRMNALNAGSTSSKSEPAIPETTIVEPTVITLDELKKVARTAYLLGQGKSQREAIEPTWECTKGGGKTWKRAVELMCLALPSEEPTAKGA